MKKYPLVLLLFLFCQTTFGQHVTLSDLTNLTNLNSSQIDDYFTAGKIFKLQYGEELNGFVVKHYQTLSKINKQETVITGTAYRSANGSLLYTVSYVTNDLKNIINLINQTKGARLNLSFQGSDAANNIYIYDNFLYHVVIKLSFNQTVCVIDITQKEVFAQQ